VRLSLSASELDRLTDLVEALQAPFDYPDVDAWRHAVNHHARLLLDAHKVVFMIPGPGHAPVYCQRLDPDGFQAYLEYYHRFDVAGGIALERRLPVSSLLEIHGREEFYASEYYNDFMKVWDCNHSVGLVTAIGAEPGFAYLGLLRDKYQDPPFDARARSLLRFLLPAFRAGIRTYLQLAGERAWLASVLEASGKRLLLCDGTGHPLQRSAALERMLAEEPERELLEKALTEVARACAALATVNGAPGSALARAGERVVRTVRGAYRLSPSIAGESGPPPRGVLVLVEPLFRELRSDSELRDAYLLTAQEIRVARALGDGLRNDEIARALEISPHTARRHTEHVLDKLGIASRAQVAERISRN
jgi:DNA-binding CsgD family transcriptional regulator